MCYISLRCRPVSDCDDNESEVDCGEDTSEQLASWAVAENISQASVTRLLTVIRKKIPELPADARTLLQTQRNVVTQTVAGGEYYYFGLRYWLENILRRNVRQASVLPDHLHLHVNIDGIPLFNSSNVPVNWIADGTKVSDFSRLIRHRSAVKFYWPPTRSAASLSKAQAAGTEPEVHWPTYLGRILGSADKKHIFS